MPYEIRSRVFSMTVRFLIADDHAHVRLRLRRILEAHPDWSVVADVENGRDAVQKTLELKPDFVILDFVMPVMDGIQAAQRIRAEFPQTPILMCTLHDFEFLRQAAAAVGIRDVLLKVDAPTRLLEACERLLAESPPAAAAAGAANAAAATAAAAAAAGAGAEEPAPPPNSNSRPIK